MQDRQPPVALTSRLTASVAKMGHNTSQATAQPSVQHLCPLPPAKRSTSSSSKMGQRLDKFLEALDIGRVQPDSRASVALAEQPGPLPPGLSCKEQPQPSTATPECQPLAELAELLGFSPETDGTLHSAGNGQRQEASGDSSDVIAALTGWHFASRSAFMLRYIPPCKSLIKDALSSSV